MPHKTPILDRGIARRMWLADACREYARFAIGASLALSLLCAVLASLAGISLLIPFAIALCGILFIGPLGMCGIVLLWRMMLGMKHSARLRPGHFRFAGILAVLLIWTSAAAGEYLLHLTPGHGLAFITLYPIFIGAITTAAAVHTRARSRPT